MKFLLRTIDPTAERARDRPRTRARGRRARHRPRGREHHPPARSRGRAAPRARSPRQRRAADGSQAVGTLGFTLDGAHDARGHVRSRRGRRTGARHRTGSTSPREAGRRGRRHRARSREQRGGQGAPTLARLRARERAARQARRWPGSGCAAILLAFLARAGLVPPHRAPAEPDDRPARRGDDGRELEHRRAELGASRARGQLRGVPRRAVRGGARRDLPRLPRGHRRPRRAAALAVARGPLPRVRRAAVGRRRTLRQAGPRRLHRLPYRARRRRADGADRAEVLRRLPRLARRAADRHRARQRRRFRQGAPAVPGGGADHRARAADAGARLARRAAAGNRTGCASRTTCTSSRAAASRRWRGGSAAEGYGAPLECADCHTPTADGVRFLPVEMEQDCESCHSLVYDRSAPPSARCATAMSRRCAPICSRSDRAPRARDHHRPAPARASTARRALSRNFGAAACARAAGARAIVRRGMRRMPLLRRRSAARLGVMPVTQPRATSSTAGSITRTTSRRSARLPRRGQVEAATRPAAAGYRHHAATCHRGESARRPTCRRAARCAIATTRAAEPAAAAAADRAPIGVARSLAMRASG